MISAIRVQRFDRIDSFGHLAVSFVKLGAGKAAGRQNWIGADKMISTLVHRIDLENLFGFEPKQDYSLWGISDFSFVESGPHPLARSIAKFIQTLLNCFRFRRHIWKDNATQQWFKSQGGAGQNQTGEQNIKA